MGKSGGRLARCSKVACSCALSGVPVCIVSAHAAPPATRAAMSPSVTPIQKRRTSLRLPRQDDQAFLQTAHNLGLGVGLNPCLDVARAFDVAVHVLDEL